MTDKKEDKGKKQPSKWGKGKTDPDTWWTKGGSSPNPKGRPKGSKNLKTIYQEAFDKKIEVTMDGERKKMSKKEVSLHQLAQKAAVGDDKATAKMLALEDKFGPVEDTPPTAEESAADYATLEYWIDLRDKFRVFARRDDDSNADGESKGHD